MSLRRKIASTLLTLGPLLMIAGGVGDLLLREPPEAWDAVVGAPVSTLPGGAVHLMMRLLDVVGSALVAAGIAVLSLVYGALRRGVRWVAFAIVVIVSASEGVNALVMASLGLPYFWGPLAFAVITLVGLLLAFVPSPVFDTETQAPERA